jgi:HEAT repeat protein
MQPKKKKTRVPFEHILNELADTSRAFSPTHLHRFSNLSEEDLDKLFKLWPTIPTERRAALLEDLEDLADADPLLSFTPIAITAINDPFPRVRAAAIRMLWEYPDVRLMDQFIAIMQNDPEVSVRAEAANALGQYVLLGELEELEPSHLTRLEECMLSVINSTDQTLVRRRALETMGYSSRPEVVELIQKAFDGNDREWMISSLFAMGRSADEHWEKSVLKMIDHHDTDIQLEAVRAAGELSIEAARHTLLKMVEKPDRVVDEVRYAAIWSLSQLGGEKAKATLEKLLDRAKDEEEAEIIENALENLDFSEMMDIDNFSMLDLESPEMDALKPVNLDEDDNDIIDENTAKFLRAKRKPKN